MLNIVAKPLIGPNGSVPRLPHYLAIEEWAAKALPPEDYFFTWSVSPTVIAGRNQDIAKEIDLEYCRDNGIQVYRRRSGGGAVYADNHNLMLSFITPSTDVETAFADYANRVASALKALGLDAKASGRNDVLIGEAKVSGNAFYRLPNRSIMHGTLLFDVDLDTMSHALTPSRAKLESKKVKSVASRVTCIKDHLPEMTLSQLNAHLHKYFIDGQYVLSEDDLAQIHEIEESYYDLNWLFGRRGPLSSPKNQKRIRKRIEGVGELDIVIDTEGGIIRDIDIKGDYFLIADLDSMLLDRVRGCQLSSATLSNALDGVDAEQVIPGLSTQTFINILANQ